VLDAIDMGLRHRDYRRKEGDDKLVHHSDAGSQYTSFRFTQHFFDADIDASIGTVGDAYDNVRAAVSGRYERTGRLEVEGGPWRARSAPSGSRSGGR
jgi:putative transposase